MSSERYAYDEQDRYRGRDRDTRVPGAAPRNRAEYGMDRPNWGSARSDYGSHAYGSRLDNEGLERRRRRSGERGFIDRTGDDFPRTERWRDKRARDVMTLDVACVRPNDSVEFAARLMRDCDCGAIPVVDRDGRLTGMITDRDIAVRLVARGSDIRRARVDDCMTDEAFACLETDNIDDCMRQMSRHQVRRMPIVDGDGRVVGIVSQSDLARHAEEHRGTGERRAVADVLCAVSERSAQSYR